MYAIGVLGALMLVSLPMLSHAQTWYGYDPYAASYGGYWYEESYSYGYGGYDQSYYNSYYYDPYVQPVYYQPVSYYPSTYYYPQPSYYYGGGVNPNSYYVPTGDTDALGNELCYWEDYGRSSCDFNPHQWVYDSWTGTWY